MHPREKARLYHDLGELLRSGIPFHQAIEKLARHARGATASVMRGLANAVAGGATMSDALARQPQINALDAALFSASDRAGMLEHGFAIAADYYGALAEARAAMWKRMAYPLFLLHFAVLALNVTSLFGCAGAGGFARAVFTGWALIWAAIFGILLVGKIALRAAESNTALDRLLALLPLAGKVRRSFALSRFCAAFGMQLEAGVNAFDTLAAAGRASASATLASASSHALASVRDGEKTGIALAATGAFPESFTRAFLVGEETGRLDAELRRLAAEYRTVALSRLDTVAEWVPRIIYVGVMLYVGYSIVAWYAGYLKSAGDLLRSTH